MLCLLKKKSPIPFFFHFFYFQPQKNFLLLQKNLYFKEISPLSTRAILLKI